MNYQCSRCGISWEGPIQECPKCEQTDKVSVQTEEKPKDACKSGTWEHDEGFKTVEKPATVPLAVAEKLAEALERITTVQGADDCGGTVWQCALIAKTALATLQAATK